MNWGVTLEALGEGKSAFEKYKITIKKYEANLLKDLKLYSNYLYIAEVYAHLKEKENFYKNFELALKNGIKLDRKRILGEPYTYYSYEERFQNLLKKYSGLKK